MSELLNRVRDLAQKYIEYMPKFRSRKWGKRFYDWLGKFIGRLEEFLAMETPVPRAEFENFRSDITKLANDLKDYFGWGITRLPWASALFNWLNWIEFKAPTSEVVDGRTRDELVAPLVDIAEQALELGKAETLSSMRSNLDIFNTIIVAVNSRLTDLGSAIYAEPSKKQEVIDNVIKWAKKLKEYVLYRQLNPELEAKINKLIALLEYAKKMTDVKSAIDALRNFKSEMQKLIAKSMDDNVKLVLNQLMSLAKSINMPISMPDPDADSFIRSLIRNLDFLPIDEQAIEKQRPALPPRAEHATVWGWTYTIEYAGYVPGHQFSERATCFIAMSRVILSQTKDGYPEIRQFGIRVKFYADGMPVAEGSARFTTKTVWHGGIPIGMELVDYSISPSEEAVISAIWLLHKAMFDMPTKIGGRIKTKPGQCIPFGGNKDLNDAGCVGWTAIDALWSALSYYRSKYRMMAEQLYDIMSIDADYQVMA